MFRKPDKKKSRSRGRRQPKKGLLASPAVHTLGLALITIFFAVALFESQFEIPSRLGGIGSAVGMLLDNVFGLPAWLLILWLSLTAYSRVKKNSPSMTAAVPFLFLVISSTALLADGDNGGFIGESVSLLLQSFIGPWASTVVLLVVLLLSIVSLTGISSQQLLQLLPRLMAGKEKAYLTEKGFEQQVTDKEKGTSVNLEQNENFVAENNNQITEIISAKRENERSTSTKGVRQTETPLGDKHLFLNKKQQDYDYQAPSLDILNPVVDEDEPSETELENIAHDVKKAMTAFNIKTEVVDWKIGPMATTFHLELSAGERFKNIESRLTDIERSMGQEEGCVRLAGNVSGVKNTVGIEIPNRKRRTCVIREALCDPSYTDNDQILPIALGLGIDGKNICEDLTEFPHLMVAGSTGSGKSVALNGIIFSLLFKKPPSELKLVLIDPKSVELAPYRNIPHLLTDVITEMDSAVDILDQLCGEMDERYETLEQNGVRNIADYHDLIGDTRSMPYIVIIIDELADLMITQGKQVEDLVGRLSQKARAAGMHLVLATQRPTSDVIKGLIKTNVPARLAFRVANKVDSRVIIQESGAETLMGLGDCLFRTPRRSGLDRIQSPLVTGEEVKKLVDHIKI